MSIYFVFASGLLLAALILIAIAINQLLKLLCERLFHHSFGNWLANHESPVILCVWAAVIAALFFFGPRLVIFATKYANALLG